MVIVVLLVLLLLLIYLSAGAASVPIKGATNEWISEF